MSSYLWDFPTGGHFEFLMTVWTSPKNNWFKNHFAGNIKRGTEAIEIFEYWRKNGARNITFFSAAIFGVVKMFTWCKQWAALWNRDDILSEDEWKNGIKCRERLFFVLRIYLERLMESTQTKFPISWHYVLSLFAIFYDFQLVYRCWLLGLWENKN